MKVESWYGVMGMGRVVTLRLPPARLAAVNIEFERSAWGVFSTECFPACDSVPVRERITARYRAGERGNAACQSARE